MSAPTSAHPPSAAPLPPALPWWKRAIDGTRDYFLAYDPIFSACILPFCVLAIILFVRHPGQTNFIFDEQEALLANPYVRSVMEHPPSFRWLDAFRRDFWGLPYNGSIGSYRPIPNLIWRALWLAGAREQSPFLHHWVNLVLHAINSSLVTLIVFKATNRRGTSWLAGLIFCVSAILTEAVSGVVGLADVLGALGVLLALASLALPMWGMFAAVFASVTFGLYSKESALCAVPLIPLAALLGARWTHPEKPRAWWRAIVSLIATAGAFIAYVEARKRMFPAPLSPKISLEAVAEKSPASQLFAAALRWYAQPNLPFDPLNNPLGNAEPKFRIAGALRIYARGLVQVVIPWPLSGDYSSPQEPIPPVLVFPWSIAGALGVLVPVIVAPALAIASTLWPRGQAAPSIGQQVKWFASRSIAVLIPILFAIRMALYRFQPNHRAGSILEVLDRSVVHPIAVALSFVFSPIANGSERLLEAHPMAVAVLGALFALLLIATISIAIAKLPANPLRAPSDFRPVIACCLIWIVVCYFPVSNIPVVLPTVRAERFWYFPAIATSTLLALMIAYIWDRARSSVAWRHFTIALVTLFLLVQCVAARRHANDYTNDLVFWNATRKAVPNSSKAHLNYSVMLGARGDMKGRYVSNKVAAELAPEWPMARIYLGDTLCRDKDSNPRDAVPHYIRGFRLAPNDMHLIALALQCLWDHNLLGEGTDVRTELEELLPELPGTFYAEILNDLLLHGKENNGVRAKYRPRGYNEGPKNEKAESDSTKTDDADAGVDTGEETAVDEGLNGDERTEAQRIDAGVKAPPASSQGAKP